MAPILPILVTISTILASITSVIWDLIQIRQHRIDAAKKIQRAYREHANKKMIS